MKKLLKFLVPYKKLLVVGPLFKLFEAILELLLPFLMAKVIDVGVQNNDKRYIIITTGLMLLTAIVGIICALICQYSASIVSQGVGTDIRNAMFTHIGILSNRDLDKIGTSSLVNRMTGDINQIQLAVAMLIRLVIRAPFLCIGGLIMAFLIDVKLSIIMVIVLPIFIIILSAIMVKSVPLYRLVQKKLDDIALIIRENLSGVRVIRAFTRERMEEKRFEKANDEYSKNSISVGKFASLLNPLTSLVMNMSIGAILWFGGLRVDSGNMSTGSIIAFIGYVTQILAALIVISNLVVIFTKAFASSARVIEVFELEGSIIGGEIAYKKDSHVETMIEFNHVTMSYGMELAPSIKDINLAIKRGETVGIIGGTGSGKSTMIQLISRLYDIDQGAIYVNGVNVKEYDLKELRSRIGLVLQKSSLFTGTILDNMKLGKEDASVKEIEEALLISQSKEFVQRLTDGVNSLVTKGGKNLSGGQRQRLCIARALVSNPDILILDDSFSALDYVTDANLRKSLKEHRKNLTTLIVSQRASTIKEADQIIVMHDGQIVGIGKHDELILSCEIYYEICQSQEVKEGGRD